MTTTQLTETNLSDSVHYELALLDALVIKARRVGHLETANAWGGLAQGLRSGQLSLSRYLPSVAWCSLFGGRAVN